MTDLFQHSDLQETGRITLARDAYLYPRHAAELMDDFETTLANILAHAPFRQMMTPGGRTMSVSMTNCGPLGWISDARGYRYEACDPVSGKHWPALPPAWHAFAVAMAEKSGFSGFSPDACLINRYQPGTKLSLHQDKDEISKTQPIVSISLGLQARFQFGGLRRKDPVAVHDLHHTDVVVWGGISRFCYHGILPLKAGYHAELGATRINLTFRQVR